MLLAHLDDFYFKQHSYDEREEQGVVEGGEQKESYVRRGGERRGEVSQEGERRREQSGG